MFQIKGLEKPRSKNNSAVRMAGLSFSGGPQGPRELGYKGRSCCETDEATWTLVAEVKSSSERLGLES